MAKDKAARPSSKDRAHPKALRLHGSIAQELGMRIVSGRYRPGHILDGEIEASEQMNVSRTAYREAVRILAAKGLVRSRPGVGTRVSPQHEWHLLDPDVLAWIFRGEPDNHTLQCLFELRTMLEPAAAGLAAARRSQRHLDAMRHALDGMRKNTLSNDAGRDADRDFHAALLDATANPFVASLTNGVTAAVDYLNEYKQRTAPLKRDPVPDHERVYDAIAAKDSEGARKAMSELIRLAMLDTPLRPRARLRKQ